MQIMYTQSTCIECLAYNGSIAIAACRNLAIFFAVSLHISNEIYIRTFYSKGFVSSFKTPVSFIKIKNRKIATSCVSY